MKLAKQVIIGVKSESTQNSAATLASTDYLLATAAEPELVPEFIERNYVHASLDTLPHVVGKVHKQVRIQVEDKGSGTAGTVYGPLDALLKASRLSSAVSPGVSVSYGPISVAPSNMLGPATSCTIEVYMGIQATALKYRLRGAIAKDAKLAVTAGGILVWDFVLMGLYEAITDASAPSVSYAGTLPPKLSEANFSVHGYAATLNKIEIDFGLSTALIPSPNAVHGVHGFVITGCDPKGSMDPDLTTVAAHDFFGRMVAGTTGAVSFQVGSTNGNITQITLPVAQYTGVKPGNRDGILNADLGLAFRQSSGDDWISIVKS